MSEEVKKFNLVTSVFQSGILEAKVFPMSAAILIIAIYSLQMILISVQSYELIFLESNFIVDNEVMKICGYLLAAYKIDLQNWQILDYLIFSLITIYLSILLFNLFVGIVKAKKKKPVPDYLKTFLIPLNYLHIFVFFLPINNFLFNLIIQILSNSALYNQTAYIITAILVFVGLFLNITFAASIEMWTLVLKNKDPFSRISNKFIYLSLLQKTTLSMLYWISVWKFSSISVAWFSNIGNLVIMILLIASLFEVIPFYTKKLSTIIYYSSIFSTSVSVWSIIVLITDQSKQELTFGYFATVIFLVSPFVMKAFKTLIDSKRSLLTGILSLSRTNKYEVVSYIRKIKKLIINEKVNAKPKKFKEKELRGLMFKKKYDFVDIVRSEKDLGIFLSDFHNSKRQTPLVNLQIAECLIKDCKFVAQSYLICNKLLSQKDVTYAERLTTLVIEAQIQNYLIHHQSGNLELVGFMKSINKNDELGNLIQQVVEEREKFYRMIGEEVPNLAHVSETSRKIQKLEFRINNLWQSLSRQNLEDYPPLLKMYSFFKIFVEFQLETGKDLFRRYKKIMAKKVVAHIVNSKSLFSVNNVFIVIGLESKNFGKVLSCTLNVKRLFGIPAIELMGKNISQLMPPTVSNAHDLMIKNRMNDADKMLQLTKIQTLAMHHKGYLMPITLNVTIYPTLSEGLSYWGMMSSPVSHLDYLIIDDKGYIEGMSYAFKKSLCIDFKQKILLANLCKIFSGMESPKLSPEHSKFHRYSPKTKPSKSKKNLFKLETMDAVHDLDQDETDENYEFMKTLKRFCTDNIDFTLVVLKNAVLRNKESRYKCHAEIQQVYNHHIATITMKRYHKRLNNAYAESSSLHHPNKPIYDPNKSEEFSKIHENSRQNSVNERVAHFLPDEIIQYGSEAFEALSENKESVNFSNSKRDDQESNADDDDDYEDPEISDMSEKQIDDRASGVSFSSSKVEQFLRFSLLQMIKRSNFYRFKETIIVFIAIFLFLIAFLAAILVMYFNSHSTTSEVKDRIEAINYLSLRGQDLGKILVDLYPVWLFDKVFQRPMDSRALFYIQVIVPFYDDLIKQNTLLQHVLNRLSEDEKEFFLRENLKMFVDDFALIPNTTKYQLVNSFTMVNALYSQAVYFNKNYAQTTSNPRNYAQNFLFGNIMNDLWIQTLEGPSVMRNAMQKTVDNIYQVNNISYYAVTATIAFLIGVLAIVIFKSYFDTVRLLGIIINAGNSIEIDAACQNLRIFKTFLSKKLQGKDMEFRTQKAKTKSSHIRVRKGKNSELLGKTIRRALAMTLLLLVPYGLIFESHNVYLDSAANIMPLVDDINKMNNIIFSGVPVQSYLGLLFIRPSTKVLNKRLTEIIDPALETFKDSVSLTNNFSPRVIELLNQDLCPYFLQNAVYSDCKLLFRNLGLKGVLTTVLGISTYQKEYRKLVSSLVPNAQNIVFLVYQYDNIEASYLFVFGVCEALAAYQRILVIELVDSMNSASTSTLIIFAPAVVFGTLITIIITYMIYKVIWKERKIDSKTVTILPLDLIMGDKGLKTYLMKECRDFYKVIKKYEQTRKNLHKIEKGKEKSEKNHSLI